MKKIVFITSTLFFLTINIFSQQEDIKITDFYKPCFYPKDDSFGFYVDPDSLKHTQMKKFGENMYAFSLYLYDNYCQLKKPENIEYLEKFLPDTIAVKEAFNDKLKKDTAFIKIYHDFLNMKGMPDIDINDIQEIAARFYFVHNVNGKLRMFRCTLKNEVLNMEQTKASPYYNAFCFMVVRNSDRKDWYSVKDDLAPYYNADKNINEEEAEKIKNQVYENLSHSEAYKQDIINEYELRKKYLNFKLLY